MATIFENDNRGNYREAWHQMQMLGAQVREEFYIEDCLAVARETMRRVRYNIELLIAKLPELGYQFGIYPQIPSSI